MTQARTFEMAGAQLVKSIEGLDPKDRHAFEQIAALGRIGKRMVTQIEELFDKAIRAANTAHKENLKIRDQALSKFEEAETLSKAKLAEGRDAYPEYEAEGAIFADAWRAVIVNAEEIPREYLMPDLTKISGVVKALKNECRIPGVNVERRTQVSLRAHE